MLIQNPAVQKSLYLFLSSILGILMFLILHRVLFLIYLLLVILDVGFVSANNNFITILAVDYVSMLFFLMLGSWYGIWLGLHWYDIVYEKQMHSGIFAYFSRKMLKQHSVQNLKERVESLAEDLKQESYEAEELARELAPEQNLIKVKVKPVAARKATRKSKK